MTSVSLPCCLKYVDKTSEIFNFFGNIYITIDLNLYKMIKIPILQFISDNMQGKDKERQTNNK